MLIAAELNTALGGARPGDTVVRADGTWHDAAIVLSAPGSASASFRIRVLTPGKVAFSGSSSLTFAAPWVTVEA